MCISSFMFFKLITYYLPFNLYLFWTMEMMLDKKHIGTVFLLSSKWVGKQWRQLATSTTRLAQEWLTNIQYSGGSRSFAKEMRPWRWAQWPAIGRWRQLLWAVIEADPLRTTWNLPKSSVLTILQPFGLWSKLERWKSSISGASWTDWKIF